MALFACNIQRRFATTLCAGTFERKCAESVQTLHLIGRRGDWAAVSGSSETRRDVDACSRGVLRGALLALLLLLYSRKRSLF